MSPFACHRGSVAVPPRFHRDAVFWVHMDQCTDGDFCAARFHIMAALPVPPARARQPFVAGGGKTLAAGWVLACTSCSLLMATWV